MIPQAVDGYFADRCGQHAAGIAYRVLFSLVPLSIVLVAIFGLVLRDDSLRDDVISEIVDALPLSESGGANVTREIEKLASPATALGLVSLLVFGWAATGMMAALRAGLEVAMRVERGRPAARGKLVDVILIVGAAALVLGVVLVNLGDAGGVATDPGAARLARARRGPPRAGVPRRCAAAPDDRRRAAALPLRAGPPAHGWATRFAGAIVTALLLLAISLASGLILDRTRSLSNIYGSLTVALVFLYTVYLYASALLLGAEVAAAWSRPFEETERAARSADPPRRAGPVRPPGAARAAADAPPRADRSPVEPSRLGELGQRLPHLGEVRLQLGRPREVGLALQVAPELALAQPEQHLGAGAAA